MTAALGERLCLQPTLLYIREGDVDQINVGAMLGVHWNMIAIYGGLRDRLINAYLGFTENEAIIPVLGIEYAHLLIGLSYDISSPNIAYYGNGGFELSLTYNVCSAPSDRINAHPKF